MRINFKNILKKNNKGFTLIEFLLYIGLLSIFLVVSLQLFSSIFEIQLESEATSSVDTDGKYIIQRITHDINRASSISVPATLGSSETSLTIVVNGENLIYDLSGGDLILENQTAGTQDQLNSSESTVTDLTFLRLDGGAKDTIQMTFTLTSIVVRSGVGNEVRVYQTSAGLR